MSSERASTDRSRTLYRPEYERDACGVGFVASVAGRPSHAILAHAIESVVHLTHRGAVAADARTGDGAGVLTQIPRRIMLREAAALGVHLGDQTPLAVAMVFFPGQDAAATARARRELEAAVDAEGMRRIGWRVVPVDPTVLGERALATQPRIEQLLVLPAPGWRGEEFERRCYLARKEFERRVLALGLPDVYVPSFSSRTIVYKGMFVAPQLAAFYDDLRDPAFETALALFHQRYSTNTFPNWYLAQPFRMLAHNGEINTLDGNRNWMAAREATLAESIWGERAATLRPVITPGGSDSCSLDNAAELLVRSGRDPLHTMLMLVPEAWENMPHMDEDVRAFYEYHACLQEPWDGPAALAFTDGVVVGAALDRNGLRPARYKLTRDLLIVASEVGTIPIDDGEVVEKGRLGPGAMIAVDTARGVVLKNDAIKRTYATRQPYRQWLAENLTRLSSAAPHHDEVNGEAGNGQQNGHAALEGPTLAQRQQACGYTNEDVRFVVRPMGADGKEPVWSMGDDAPLAILSLHRRPIYAYFRQRFAQVTNPPIDPLREQLVMALDTYIGRRGNLLAETPEHARLLHLSSPMLLEGDLRAIRQLGASNPTFACAELDATFPTEQGPAGLESALADLCVAAELAVDAGRSVLIISDRTISARRAPIPMPLAVGAVHHHLIRAGKRTLADIVAEAGDVWDIHHFAVLIGYGASAVHPYLALATVRAFAGERGLEQMSADELEGRYREAVNLGLLKIMSKMGISAIASYRGAQIFEILGLDQSVVDRCFAGTSSPIGGIGLRELAEDVLARHREAFPPPPELRLRDLGLIRYRSEGEYHLFNRPLVKAMQAAASGDRHAYRHMVNLDQERPPAALRDLLDFVPRQPIPLSEVEPVESIRRRFISTAMSLGALSPEAYTTLAIAMNMMGARSNSGEGGEDPTWYYEGDPLRVRHSKIKQVASGRFGVTAEYLAHAEEIEIKMAQGSKPGEGGQLPGHKVTELIARLRHAVPGIPLISPPPHHDIYSIEDLAQLIYDLKRVNPRARVGVKLVATVGVGTIAAGVAKAYADYVLISGHSGGTGASPLSSIKHAGSPWELGLAETQQVLVMNDLRARIVVRTDGALKTGRDIVIAALLGAEEYGFGTAALIAMGCDMARQCHLNTCPTGIATQRPELRTRFDGRPEQVVNYFTHVAEEVREILAQLGLRSLDEAVGRVDLLRQVEREGFERANALDLGRLLAIPAGSEGRPRRCLVARNQREDKPLDEVILRQVAAALDHGTPVFARYAIANHQRTVGATVAGEIGKRYGLRGLPEGTITCEFHGTAGQSFGAFLAPGMRWVLIGEANDYVGKGMCGGEIIIRPPDHAAFAPHQNVIIGNTVLYGATGGYLFVNGRAGERFAVRNSGAQAVIEGVGDHGCEYMTGGVVVVLGPTGRNFGAGMSAGVAFVLDEERVLEQRYNREMVALERVEDPEDIALLQRLIRRHHELTGSAQAARVLDNWERMLPLFRKVMPHPLREWRKKQLAAEQAQQAGAAATGTASPATRAKV